MEATHFKNGVVVAQVNDVTQVPGRSLAQARCDAAGIELRVPKPRLCTDNGVMIAALGAHVIDADPTPTDLGAATDPGLSVTLTKL